MNILREYVPRLVNVSFMITDTFYYTYLDKFQR